eukprot:3177248-Amphidinium_carterae.2
MLPVLCLASSAPVIEIAPGVKLPYVSLGLGSGQKGNVTQAVPDWISVGGKSFDTALIYGDQEALVKGLHAAHVAQKDVFIISKVERKLRKERVDVKRAKRPIPKVTKLKQVHSLRDFFYARCLAALMSRCRMASKGP